jgi:CP family cyanate transporter-like MFS transporter
LLVVEILPVMLTIPVILPLAHASWRGALAIWSIPFFVIAAITLVLAPKADEPVRAARAPVRWWPDWRNKQTWQLGFLLGSVNSVYFCTNAFLPGHLAHAGRSDLVVGALTALNLGQLPASIALLALSRRIERTPWPFVACGGLMLVCIAGIVATASAWTYLFAGVLGFVGAAVLTLALALPPLLNAPRDVARLTAAMFTISYCEGLVISVLSGAAWDVAGDPRFAFLPIAISAIPLLFIPGMIRLERRVTS